LGRAFKPPPASDGHRCASTRRIPTCRPTFSPTARALPGVPASAPKHLGGDARLSKGHGASCRLACRSPRRKDALVSDFAVCARNSDRYTRRGSVCKRRSVRTRRSI
jgi:hypothetical protein